MLDKTKTIEEAINDWQRTEDPKKESKFKDIAHNYGYALAAGFGIIISVVFILYQYYMLFQVPSYELAPINVPRKKTIELKGIHFENPPERKKEEKTEKPMSVKDRILSVAEKKQFPYKSYLLKLAYCESRMNPSAINSNSNGTRDCGVFQINDVHGLPDSFRFDVEKSTEWTIDYIMAGRQSAWVCDKHVKAGKFNYIKI
jgi:hypothetical protein